MSEDTLLLVPAGKLRCYISGKLRNDTPEEHVRQRVSRSLVEEYGYRKADIEIEFRVQMGSAKKSVDIAIFESDAPHKQDRVYIIGETKREEVKPNDRDDGVAQLHSYLSACPNASWGLWVGSEFRAFRKAIESGKVSFPDEPDIPAHGRVRPSRIRFDQLVPADSLKPVFRRIHNYIYANQGLPKDQAFHELLKLIFCKVYDEEASTGEMRFDVDEDERLSVLGQKRLKARIDELFERVKAKFAYIFEGNDVIKLSERVLAYAVSELRRYSLLNTRTDVKGEAYQELVRDNLRGDRGEFFTPDNVCRMAVEMAYGLFTDGTWSDLRVLDPACGTGGFLRAAMNLLRGTITQREMAKDRNSARAEERAKQYLKETCERVLFGVDINPLLVRAAQMNLVMHGDGSSNIERADSLSPVGEWPEGMRRRLGLGSFDLVFTNPPFGNGPGLAVDDPHVLEQYELAIAGMERGRRNKMPPEQLFIERCAQYLRPGGVLAIVLPDSILSNPGLRFIRDWALSRFRVLASIDLPLETFIAFSGTGTQTSVLLLQTKTREEMRIEQHSERPIDHEVFMAIPRTMGYDRRGNDLWRRSAEGDVTWLQTTEIGLDGEPHEVQRPIRDDEVSDVAPTFLNWLREEREAG